MADWISQHRYRFLIVVCVYFAIHVLVRVSVSSSLDFDETEQVFLSQWTLLGYNSQPPLYTWMQQGLFRVLGYNVFSLALLKNSLLLLTYVTVFELVRKTTDNTKLAVLASLGMLTIPQIAYESHRDLSHTVSVTLATAALMYCVVSVEKCDRLFWYLAIGVTSAFGMMSKYNFAIILVAIAISAITIPSYRRRLLDWRLGWSLLVGLLFIAPHSVWMLNHPLLVSSKTVKTLTTDQSIHWLANVGSGMQALVLSTLACCAVTLAVFTIAYRDSIIGYFRDRDETAMESIASFRPTALLIERFFLVIAMALVLLVLSGQALEFRNRWIQPFVCLLPAYLVLRFGGIGIADRVGFQRMVLTSVLLMVFVLSAVSSRPLLARFRQKYLLLNVPFDSFAETMRDRCGYDPELIITPNMRIAGNMKMQFPTSLVLSMDTPYLLGRDLSPERIRRRSNRTVVVTDFADPGSLERLADFTYQTLQQDSESVCWQTIGHPYLHGDPESRSEFTFARLDDPLRHVGPVESTASVSDRIPPTRR
ncbi:ArnT family glycosyltransferase [Novipirellula artificiosorum]|uniref:Dolichyl-phosphate-mannose-protein mannosyltransferase n=1 Tax=Novipirellula artificiosorum TaxID=2528016 RepID=A0A5C6E3Q1_9BACT|nr:glycosyltransferase family 39 protein [Novipirellula artificiosorum]TWU41829.1 Dolichyl-phosphate-mannose-protein mannosyltransferase [Novipirellula artificiosorum]